MTQARHLVSVWNPSYADDAMDAHMRGLLGSAERARIETHLYLTDYRSLYVAELDEITADRIRSDSPGEVNHMPEYYEGMLADLWFRLLDIRRVVSDDTPGVIGELKKLRNKRYNDRPVSLYGGMVDMPLIVSRENEVSWFGDREALLDGEQRAERDAHNRSDTERMMRELRDNKNALAGGCYWVHYRNVFSQVSCGASLATLPPP